MNTIRELQKFTAPLRDTTVIPTGRDQLNGSPGNHQPEVIATKNLRVEFASRELGSQVKVAVKNLTLSVHAGEVFGFLGPNGAGKTTTMNVLLGFANATSGSASIFGVNVEQTIARQRLGYLPELTYYYKFLTAEELLRFYSRIFGIEKAERERRIDAVLKLVELEHARKRLIKTYSKGMQQRVGLAQALINNPDLLILDEPTSGLDPLGRMKVRDIIKRLKNEGKTVFFSSHELGEVETVCDRVAIMHEGELMVEGRVDDLAREHQCNLEQLFLKIVGYQPENI
jgi:ABC-2 type transport system ATP-binding protein